ncbi:hypothetical protein QBC32DRAFT_62313 [Pseudoneurospora amorphoporcata]|uniref:Uncharacterized protein n=1 Tax=Pseudoneurospora amorphoporcata TaxID=241081 RepID=A0AAN6NR47_9PEZI|nr:hypothetical protein QBC32DRAFT_62313 [Pseudoneurospora amorphoporcata]
MSSAPRRSNSTCPRPGSSSGAQPFPRTPSRTNGLRPSQYQQSTPERRNDWRTDPRDTGRRPSQYHQATPERREDWRTDPRAQQTPEQQTQPSFDSSHPSSQRPTPDARTAPRRPSDQRSPPNNPRSNPRRPSANNWSANNTRSSQSGSSPNNKAPRPDEAATKTQMNQTLSIALMTSPANPLPFPLPIPLGISMLLVGSSKSGK